MPPQWPERLTESHLRLARDNMCRVFGIEALREHQEEAGQSMMRGQSVIYDVPTGGGKTMAFWYPLFYHWAPGIDSSRRLKVLVVISPLNALMNAQVKDLVDRGIPAIALNSAGGREEDIFEERNGKVEVKHRVVFVSPEKALSPGFSSKVLKNPIFVEKCIGVVIDEAHCISEWGGDFRPEYAVLSQLLGRLPDRVPVLVASATLPPDVLSDIQHKLQLPTNCKKVAVSNAKLNVALSVRVMQQPQDTYADLLSLFPKSDTPNPSEFPQTLIYVNSRSEAEGIQDFLRKHRPQHLPAVAFEFYHRYIDEERKVAIQEGLRDGTHLGVPATDALGMGMDFRNIKCVILWHAPRTFSSLVQKVGRCVRKPQDIGEAVLYLTKAAYTRHVVEFDTDEGDEEEIDDDIGDPNPDPTDARNIVGTGSGEFDRIAAIDREDPPEDAGEQVQAETQAPGRRRGAKKVALSALEARDRKYMAFFVATSKCRRKAWDEFFENSTKLPSPFTAPPGVRCCDNCTPNEFPVDVIKIKYPYPTRFPRTAKPSEELQEAVRSSLQRWRRGVIDRDFPMQRTILPDYLMSDELIDKLVARPRAVTSPGVFRLLFPWTLGTRFGDEVVKIVQEQVIQHPDAQQVAREEANKERQFNQWLAAAEKQRREKLIKLFQECFDAVYQVETGDMVPKGRGQGRHLVAEKMCAPFINLPRRNDWSEYYEVIKEPISMSNIRQMMMAKSAAKGFGTVNEYIQAWRLLFRNCRTFNEDGSDIVDRANHLEQIFDAQLEDSAARYNISLDGDAGANAGDDVIIV